MKNRSVQSFWCDTPFGNLADGVDEAGVVVAAAFGELESLRARAPAFAFEPNEAFAPAVRQAVDDYFRSPSGPMTAAIAPEGTEFQRRVWDALRAIPAGETRIYGRLAMELDSSPRAIGGAIAANPIALFIPCHRVIGTDGSLTGAPFGETLKRALLTLEGAMAAP